MFKRILAFLGLSAAAVIAAEKLSFGGCEIEPPTGWREAKRTNEVLVIKSADGKEQATVSTLSLHSDATLDDFKQLCQKRIEGEKRELRDGFVKPQEPFQTGDVFIMMFSGGDKKTGRIFSGYLNCSKRELITLYVEGIGTAPTNHLATFKQFVKGFKRK